MLYFKCFAYTNTLSRCCFIWINKETNEYFITISAPNVIFKEGKAVQKPYDYSEYEKEGPYYLDIAVENINNLYHPQKLTDDDINIGEVKYICPLFTYIWKFDINMKYKDSKIILGDYKYRNKDNFI